MQNPIGLLGLDFIEFASPAPEELHRLFNTMGFSRTRRHTERDVDMYEQGDIRLLLNREPDSFAARFAGLHGPSISAMGWRISQPTQAAHRAAVVRGAQPASGDYRDLDGRRVDAFYGVGNSLIYLVADTADRFEKLGFIAHPNAQKLPTAGFELIDHLTNNVEAGEMVKWTDFYKNIFGFTDVRTFDIRGEHTGLVSYALRSPCGTFCIPINEASEKKSQINEYLEEYKGAGIQHLAFLTNNLVTTLQKFDTQSDVKFLDVDSNYYDTVFDRVPNVVEDHAELKKRQILVDGDDKGYLLQIFTNNLIGPIFFELIQRKNHASFGEGNFSALFRSIERDQVRRGYLDEVASASKV